MRRKIQTPLLAVLLLGLTGCDLGLPAGRTPHREFNRLDMGDQPRQKPQRKDLFGARATGMMEPQAGTVARNEMPYPFAQNEGEKAGEKMKNPLPATPEVMAHGKFMFENVCITCHGPKGAGDGHVTALFPKPPSLMTQKVRDWPDGQLYHRPMRGQNSMPSHARQVDARDIWSIVHYIRKMQSELPVAPPPAVAGTVAPVASTSAAPAAPGAKGGKP